MMRLGHHFFLLIFLLTVSFSAHAEMIDFPQIKIQALNKSTARTENFTAKVGETIEYGSLFIKIQSCRKSEPLDKPEDAAFLQIWEVPIGKEKSEWAFSGWMFSSSPAVSAMDHAIYDVWVLECFDPDAKKVEPVNRVIVNDEEVVETPTEESENLDEETDESNEEPAESLGEVEEQPITVPVEDAIEEATSLGDEPQSNIIEAEPFDAMIEDIVTYE